MNKTLILVRHAKSSWQPTGRKAFSGCDLCRPLNKRGVQGASLLAKHIASRFSTIDKVFYSNALRTIQTFDAINSVFRFSLQSEASSALYAFEADCLWQFVKKLDNRLKTVAVVGHNPAIHEFCLAISTKTIDQNANTQLEQKYPTGAVACINSKMPNWKSINSQTCILNSFVWPKILPQT